VEEKQLPLSAVTTVVHLSIAKAQRIHWDQVLAVELFEFQDDCAGLALNSLSVEVSNQAMFPVESLLGTSPWLNLIVVD